MEKLITEMIKASDNGDNETMNAIANQILREVYNGTYDK